MSLGNYLLNQVRWPDGIARAYCDVVGPRRILAVGRNRLKSCRKFAGAGAVGGTGQGLAGTLEMRPTYARPLRRKAFMKRADQAGKGITSDARRVKRVVVVADNPLIVAAIRSGVRETGAFELLGYINPVQATAARIAEVGADLMLVDEAEGSEPAIALIRAVSELDANITVIVLTIDMHGEWLQRAFEAGANGALSKAIHPVALATLVREASQGHIVHAPVALRPAVRSVTMNTSHDSLTVREIEILQLVAAGSPNGEIARQLWITQQTVKFHVSNIYRKLGVSNRTEACHYAHVHGLATASEMPRFEQREQLAVAS
ncbi:MAG: LuxR C-terminal-related transcriptional regulator [Solirubrobacteraceae bacterium]